LLFFLARSAKINLEGVAEMRKIMLAVDGTESSMKAAEKTADLIVQNSEITMVNVIEEAVKEEQITENVQKMMERAAAYFEEKNFKVNKEIHYGHPAEIICKLAEEDGYDLIVVADRGDEGRRFLLGSTSDRVMRYAKTSVLVVK